MNRYLYQIKADFKAKIDAISAEILRDETILRTGVVNGLTIYNAVHKRQAEIDALEVERDLAIKNYQDGRRYKVMTPEEIKSFNERVEADIKSRRDEV